MKRITKKSLERLSLDLKESWRIETKMLKTNERLTQEEIDFLKARANEGSPLGEFDYGLYYLFLFQNEDVVLYFYQYYQRGQLDLPH